MKTIGCTGATATPGGAPIGGAASRRAVFELARPEAAPS